MRGLGGVGVPCVWTKGLSVPSVLTMGFSVPSVLSRGLNLPSVWTGSTVWSRGLSLPSVWIGGNLLFIIYYCNNNSREYLRIFVDTNKTATAELKCSKS